MVAQNSTTPISLPIFDLSQPSQALANSIVSALQTYGFLFLRSTSLPLSDSDISTTFSLSSAFFHSSQAAKEQVPMQANDRGWAAMHSEELDPTTSQAGDPKEAFNLGGFEAGKAAQPLPDVFAEPAAEAHFAQFQSGCRILCLQLLVLIGQGLRVSETDWFAKRHDPATAPSGSILRLLYYPAASSAASAHTLRAGAHSDYGSLTLLFRRSEDPGGLEIQTETGWSAVPVRPQGTESDVSPPILVNIGDLLSYWTGGLLRSTVHRVTFAAATATAAEGEDSSAAGKDSKAKERYSIAYFCHPCRDTRLEPVPSAAVQEFVRDSASSSAEFRSSQRVITAAEHLQQRLRATYGWKTEEVPTV